MRELRKARKMSLSELAEKTGIAKSYLSSIERGLQLNPSVNVIDKICEGFRVPRSYFIQEAEPAMDEEWLEIIQEAIQSNVTKEQIKEYIDFIKWKNEQ